MPKSKYVIEKLTTPPKVETDERGNEFIHDSETGRNVYYSGTAKNLEEALTWMSDKHREERLREQYPDAPFLEGHA